MIYTKKLQDEIQRRIVEDEPGYFDITIEVENRMFVFTGYLSFDKSFSGNGITEERTCEIDYVDVEFVFAFEQTEDKELQLSDREIVQLENLLNY